ncbi:hypothetical protein [Psychroflexus maritimus]|uniref:Uncharacterized protein n=1 Tax=Psychroflexus maritimus TaxID=2714865 RepID=A0A967AFD5_9FLAO|nr:hypothetical protein [Psychroflexus maritimus]NGZ90745.1 hypothetical protein [Psychroflexus maritimus]
MKGIHDLDPQMIDRGVVMVIPKPKFYEWEEEVFPGSPTTADRNEFTSYLIDDEAYNGDAKQALKKHWKFIFENELFSVCTDDALWPKRRTWKSFNEFFEVKFSTMVFDLLDDGVYKANY